jgi:soluble lytic murein transglycosylase-like protein
MMNLKASDRFDSLIQFWAEEHGLPFDRVKLQVGAESSFDPRKVSPVGAIGLLQLMPGTAAEMGVDPYSIDENLQGGTAYLAKKIGEVTRTLGSYGATEEAIYRMALAAYNAGFGYVKLAIVRLRKLNAGTEWPAFIDALSKVGLTNGKRADIKQVSGYVLKILPPPLDV